MLKVKRGLSGWRAESEGHGKKLSETFLLVTHLHFKFVQITIGAQVDVSAALERVAEFFLQEALHHGLPLKVGPLRIEQVSRDPGRGLELTEQALLRVLVRLDERACLTRVHRLIVLVVVTSKGSVAAELVGTEGVAVLKLEPFGLVALSEVRLSHVWDSLVLAEVQAQQIGEFEIGAGRQFLGVEHQRASVTALPLHLQVPRVVIRVNVQEQFSLPLSAL